MEIRILRLLLGVLLAMAPAGVALADDDASCKGASSECVRVGGWDFSLSLGAGVRTDPVVHEGTIPLVVIPHLSYYGEHFFLDNLDVGWTFIDGDHSTLSLIASPGYDRVYFYRSDLQNIFVTGVTNFTSANTATNKPPPNNLSNTVPPPANGSSGGQSGQPGQSAPPSAPQPFPARSRLVTYLAGPEWTFKFHGISGQVDALHEITGHYHGDEVRAALGIPLSHVGGSWGADVGVTWKSASEVNYYYGAPGVYEGGAALDPFLKLAYSRPLKGKWNITAFVECERLANSITDSPIINQRVVTTAFVGTTYSF